MVFTVEQTKQFLELVRGHRWEMIYLIAIGGGLREGENLALAPQEVNPERKVVYITKALQIPAQTWSGVN